MRNFRPGKKRVLGAVALAYALHNVTSAAPVISQPFASRFQITNATPIGDVPVAVQMAFAPNGRLYVTSYNASTSSYAFNPVTGALTDKRSAGIGTGAFGLAFATHAVPGQAARAYMYVSRSRNFESSITRYSDNDGDGTWGEAGEVNVDIVRGVPSGDHTMDQIQIRNDQLFVGIGARTNNGRSGNLTGSGFHDEPSGPVFGGGFNNGGNGFTYGETSYNGAIGTIRDLTLVPNTTSAAQLRDGPNGTSGNLLAGRDAFLPSSPRAHLPYTSSANDKLVVHSAGTRNPFGLAIDSKGELWFTNNYGRADTNGDGTSTPHQFDDLDSDLSNDVHDQLFRAAAGGDYRYDNTNFRGTTGFPTSTVISTTFDNLDSAHPNFGDLHVPANPVGLGPSSSANGLDFGRLDLTGLMETDEQEYALVTRWNGTIQEIPPGTDSLTYQDVLVVDPQTGAARRLVEGFGRHPVDIIADGHGGFLIAEHWSNETIWRITPRVASSRWSQTGGGTWSNAGNWTGPVPNGIGAVANFTGAIQSDAQVFVDGPKVIGTLNFDNLNRYALGGSSTLTINVASGFGAINAIRGSHVIQTPVHLAKNTTIHVTPGSALTLAGPQSATAGVRLTKAGGGVLEIKHLRADEVVLGGGTTRILDDGTSAATSRVKVLTLAGGTSPGARLDLTNNAIVIDYTGASPLATVAAQIDAAHNGGDWSGNGIGTSLGNATQFAIGYAEASALSNIPSIFGSVDGTSVLARYTRYGDADLSGTINLVDFNRLASNFGQSNRGWWEGNFNYDNVVNLSDFNLLASNFGLSAGPDGVVDPEDWAALASAIPEPTGALIIVSLSCALALHPQRRASRFSG